MSAAPLTKPTVPPERGRVISDCRDFTIRRLRDSLRGMLEKIEEDLVARAEAELDRDQRNLYMFTCGKTRQQWAGIEQTFIDHLTRYFDARVRGDPLEPSGAAVPTSLDELSLVAEDDLTQELAVHELTRKLKEHCDEELFGVGQRLGSLLGKPDPTDQDNPLGTEGIAKALRAACEEVDASVQMRLVLLQSLESQISLELSKLYQDLNVRLQRQNVLPGLRRGFRRNPGTGAGGVRPAAAGTLAGQGGGLGTGAESLGANLQDAAFTSSMPGFGVSSVPGGFGEQTVSGTTNDPEGDIYAMLAQLVQGQMAAQGIALQPAGVAGAPAGLASPFVFEALSALQSNAELSVPATASYGLGIPPNLLRDFRTSELGRHLGQFDAITVDIVAMLFDLIFDDADIADPIKALVGRLQIPLVKVAMLDRSFFSSKAHPARRLLDLISQSMMRWGRDVGHEDPLYIKLAEIVDCILRDFDRDLGLFEACTDDLNAFVTELEAGEAQRAEAAAVIASAREQERQRREDARRAADDEIDDRLRKPLPGVVQSLLDGVWRRLLRKHVEGGMEATVDSQQALATADELIWSVQPKADAEARRSLVVALPGLLRRLNQGFDSVGAHPADKLMLLNGLFDLHAQWIKPGVNEPPPAVEPWVPGVSSANDDEPAPEVISEHVEQDGLELDDVSLNLPAHLDIQEQDRVQALKRGDWVEFEQADGGFARMRLNWVSPQRGIYLFTNPGSPRATSIAPDALALQLARGEARIVNNEPMFDRVVNQALGKQRVR
jgi:exonuclease VII small subunit